MVLVTLWSNVGLEKPVQTRQSNFCSDTQNIEVDEESYCKFGSFRENFIFAKSAKDIFATFKIHD